MIFLKLKVLLKIYRPPYAIFTSIANLLLKTHAKRTQVIKQKLIDAYLDKELKQTTFEVRKSYRQMRQIMFSWMHQNVRSTFSAWHEYTKHSVYWKRKQTVESGNGVQLEAAAGQVESLYRQFEFDKWSMQIDPFSDKPYWTHRETGVTAMNPPQLEEMHYIPRRNKIDTPVFCRRNVKALW